jgi:Tol biopolymer transport system component
VLAVTSQASAAPSGRDGKIAFDSRRAGSWDVFVMNGKGNKEHRLSGNSRRAADSRPAWAPPPNEIPFMPVQGDRDEVLLLEFCPNRVWFGLIEATVVCDQGVFTVTVPSSATTGRLCIEMPSTMARLPIPARVDPNPFSAIDFTVPGTTVSTRGVECPTGPIVFQSDRTGDFDLWALDSARNGVEKAVHLLSLPGTNETAPAWSPRQDEDTTARPSPLIAFARRSQGSQDIWVFDPSRDVNVGTNPSRLTSGAADDTNPDWSPDGGSIAFERHRGKRTEIWLMDVVVDGEGYRAEGLRNRTADQPPSFDPTWYQYDGHPGTGRVYEQITFGGPNGRFGFDLNYIEQDVGVYLPRFQDAAGIRARFFHRRGVEASPAYSPLGAALAFTVKRRGNSDIYLIQVGGSQGSQPSFRSVKRLTRNRADDRNPGWQALWHDAQVGYRRPWGRRARFPRRPECRVFQPAAELAAHTCASPIAYW